MVNPVGGTSILMQYIYYLVQIDPVEKCGAALSRGTQWEHEI